MPPAKIAVLSDIHMRNEYREELNQELDVVINELKEFKPDLVIALGDIIQHEEASKEDRENIRLVKEKLDKLNCEKRYLAGNHDSVNLANEELTELFGNKLWGSTQIKGENLIFLNTSAPWLSGSRGEVTAEQLEFLEDELDRVEEATIFVHHGLPRAKAAGPKSVEEATIFVHHPIHYHDVQDTYWWTNYPERAFCGNKKEINRVISEYENVRLAINGHIHENDLTNYEGVPHITLNAFSRETREKPITGTYTTMKLGNKTEISVKIKDRTVKEYTIE